VIPLPASAPSPVPVRVAGRQRSRRGTRKDTRALTTYKQESRVQGTALQVVSAPDEWPLWTSDVRPGREHDTTAARADPVLLQRISDWVDAGALALADLGYEGEAGAFRIPVKKAAGTELTVDQQA
jgi:hypothetical protein